MSVRWAAYALLAFLGNGVCSTVQKAQQIAYEGRMKSEFMIIALSLTILILLLASLISDRGKIVDSLRIGAPWYIASGVANAGVNLLVMLLSTRMSASVTYPVMSGGGIILSAAVSMTVYREKLSRVQLIGVLLGVGAVVALSL